MGEVYKAKDLRLGRDVAIKVLPQELASDSDRLRRFEREARAASALNHPNIVTIYEIGEHEDTPYIAMEYVEGQTLREILARGALSNDKLMRYASQMAEGLAKAHQARIVHRDLKPENVVISEDGYVKILDFGLAKLLPLDELSPEASTLAREGGTTPGAILGTVSYMSPEQAKAQSVDHRSDQFAYGAIVYEMATGKRAFEGETSAETLSAVLRDEPGPADALGVLEPIVRRCLSKRAELRYGSTTEILEELRAVESKPSARSATLRSIAVLPLVNLSSDPEQEFFVDGMTEALITELSKIRALTVISRTSAMQYKDVKKAIPEIARELGVDAVIEGSVLRFGDTVRITAQLIDAAADRHLWADNFDREMRDIFALLSDVARAIAHKIRIAVTPEEETRLTAARAVSPESHVLHLKGLYQFNKQSIEAYQIAIKYAEQAIAADPNHAGAHALLADCYGGLAWLGHLPAKEACANAGLHIAKALEIDDNLAEAHQVMGNFLLYCDWDWGGAEKEYRRAIELSPSFAAAHYFYAGYLYALGRFETAIAEARRGRQLDPLSVQANFFLGDTYFHARQYDRAIAQYQHIAEVVPNDPRAYLSLALAYRHQEMYEEMITVEQKALILVGAAPEASTALRQAYRESGLEGYTTWKLENLKRSDDPFPLSMAAVYAELGDSDQALTWLEKAYEGHIMKLAYLKSSPEWDPLRSDPRFRDLLDGMNFPD